ncbi:MAG: malate/lactate/ureidoglycolate dehydrogenase [Acetobacteraceae bacterium]
MTRRIAASGLADFVSRVFAAAGSCGDEPRILADHLVEANLLGHDSHGVIRVPKYLVWLAAGEVIANRHAEIAFDRGPILAVNGGFGYGQVIGREAMALLAERCRSYGLAAVAIRNTGHLGRIGAWPEQLARAGLVSIHFVNTSGYGILVAPHGGSDRRLSANPVAAGAPGPAGRPLVLDIATSAIAEGKLQLARNKGEQVSPGAILDGAGRPTRSPEAFYAEPPGSILPFGGHKGSGLSFFCEVLAGSLTGGMSSHPENPTARHLVNNMLSIAFVPDAFTGRGFDDDLARLAAWVKGSPPSTPGGAVLLPGEAEARTRREREEHGIPLDEESWRQLVRAAAERGVAAIKESGERR